MFDVSVWHGAHDYPLLRVPSRLKALAIHSVPGTHLVRRRSSWVLSWRSEALSVLNLASWMHWYIGFQSCLSRVRAVTILIWYWTQFFFAHLPYHIHMRILPNVSAWAVQHRVRPSAPKSLVCPIQNECSFDVCSEVQNYSWIIEVAVAQDATPANLGPKNRGHYSINIRRKASMENLPKVINRRKEGLR